MTMVVTCTADIKFWLGRQLRVGEKKERETAEYSLRDGWISKPVKLAGISLSFVGGGFTDNIPRAGLILWFRELCEWQNKNDIRVSHSHFSAEFIFMSSSQTTSIQNWSQIICRSETTDTFGVCGCSLLNSCCHCFWGNQNHCGCPAILYIAFPTYFNIPNSPFILFIFLKDAENIT